MVIIWDVPFPPPVTTADFSGTVLYNDAVNGLGGATVDILDDNGNPLVPEQIAGVDGSYSAKGVNTGNVTVNIIFNGDIVGTNTFVLLAGVNQTGVNVVTNR